MWPLKKTQDTLIKDREVIRHLGQMVTEFTPDFALLEEHQRILFFACDDMMSGQRNSDMIAEHSVTGRWPLAHCYTLDKFQFWVKELGKLSYPVVLDKPATGKADLKYDVDLGRVWGELYAIRPQAFIKLDIERENKVQYTRRRVEVIVPYTQWNPTPSIKEKRHWPMMYVGNHDYWDDQLAGPHLSRTISKTPDSREWLGPHYRFK
jgi:hypothetical protein